LELLLVPPLERRRFEQAHPDAALCDAESVKRLRR
jgi:hypothetical protein